MLPGVIMDKDTNEKLEQLINDIGGVPLPQRDKLIELANKTGKCHKQLTESISRLQGSLDGLRLSVKYLIFDLEATRRENVELKKSLDEDDNNK